jgi:hypothetical protein
MCSLSLLPAQDRHVHGFLVAEGELGLSQREFYATATSPHQMQVRYVIIHVRRSQKQNRNLSVLNFCPFFVDIFNVNPESNV